MNMQLLSQIRDWLLAGAPHINGDMGFNMSTFWFTKGYSWDFAGHPCGTSMCIAGAACQFSEVEPEHFLGRTESLGMQLLDLTEDQAKDLFFAEALQKLGVDLKDITPSKAAAVIQHLMDTGEVDWLRVYSKEELEELATLDY